MSSKKLSVEDLIVNSPMGFARVDDRLRPVEVETLEDLAKVARLRSLPILHHRSDRGNFVWENYVILDVPGGFLYRLAHKPSGTGQGNPNSDTGMGRPRRV